MKHLVTLLFIVSLFASCKNEASKKETDFVLRNFSSVEIETLIQDSTLNVRALELLKNEQAFIGTSDGRIGVIGTNLSDKKNEISITPYTVKVDTFVANFRSVAVTSKAGFLLSIGAPAFLFKSSDFGVVPVYTENHPKAFYDSMEFWNDQEGIAIGDPTDDCLSVIITRDSGNTWNKLSCDDLPKAKEGEAAFAASDTNIKIIGDKTWVATGGKASRILYSPDKGKTWKVFETPIVQGISTTGIYSIDFYDELNGFAIGGDYTKPEDNTANKIRTRDGGKTWQLIAENENPGYRSCVQYVPNSNAKSLVAIGFKGIDISNDSGATWNHLSDESYYTLRFLNDSSAYAAGKGRISKLVFR